MRNGAVILGVSEVGERVVASSARLSTTQGSALEIYEKPLDREKDRKLISKVLSLGHRSAAEHLVFNIAFCNVSVFVEQFMIEFRLASFMVKSRRYVDFASSGYYVPKGLNGEQRKIFAGQVESLFTCYQEFTEKGVPKEDARFLLPYCFYSNFYVTVNARELHHILNEMLYGRGAAFTELRTLGQELLGQVLETSPEFFEGLEEGKGNFEQPALFKEPEGLKDKIEILNAPSNPQALLEAASIVSSGRPLSLDEIFLKARKRELEQLSYTVALNGLSLAGITHLARHRMQSLIVPPLTAITAKNYIVPPTVAADPELTFVYREAFSRTNAAVEGLRRLGVPAEGLLYLSQSGNTLNTITTMNARELYLFFKLRTCNRAQWEIRAYADELLRKLRKISPEIFGRMGPGCFAENRCPEGKMSCGDSKNVVERYR